jgi:acyl carrier protein
MDGLDNLKARLNQVFRQVFDDPSLSVAETTTADDVPGWDSLTHIDLIVAVEKEFGVSFTTREVMTFDNVGALIASVAKKTNR